MTAFFDERTPVSGFPTNGDTLAQAATCREQFMHALITDPQQLTDLLVADDPEYRAQIREEIRAAKRAFDTNREMRREMFTRVILSHPMPRDL